jgi:hypothetical protein
LETLGQTKYPSETQQEERKSQTDSEKEIDFEAAKTSGHGPCPGGFGTVGWLDVLFRKPKQ